MRAMSTVNRNGLVMLIIRARFETANGVRLGVMAGQHDDRSLEAVLVQDTRSLAAVDIG